MSACFDRCPGQARAFRIEHIDRCKPDDAGAGEGRARGQDLSAQDLSPRKARATQLRARRARAKQESCPKRQPLGSPTMRRNHPDRFGSLDAAFRRTPLGAAKTGFKPSASVGGWGRGTSGGQLALDDRKRPLLLPLASAEYNGKVPIVPRGQILGIRHYEERINPANRCSGNTR